MKRIGIDISIQVCRAEGYPVVEYSGNGSSIDKDKPFRITVSNPKAWSDNGYHNRFFSGSKYLIDDFKSFNDLLEILNRDYKAISSFTDYKNCKPNLDNPTISDYLFLASDLIHYYGEHY